MISKQLCVIAIPFALGLVTGPAAANTITYHWDGIIQDFDVKFGSPDLAVGKRFGIDLIVDDSTPDSDSSQTVGQYDYHGYNPANPPRIVVKNTVSGLHYPYQFGGIEEHATVLDDHDGIDGFTISAEDYHGIGNVFTFNFSTPNTSVPLFRQVSAFALSTRLRPGHLLVLRPRPQFSPRVQGVHRRGNPTALQCRHVPRSLAGIDRRRILEIAAHRNDGGLVRSSRWAHTNT